MDVEVVGRTDGVVNFPHLGVADGHDFVDTAQVHVLAVDAGDAELEDARPGRVLLLQRGRVGEYPRDHRGRLELVGSPQLQDVEAVVGTTEALLEEASAGRSPQQVGVDVSLSAGVALVVSVAIVVDLEGRGPDRLAYSLALVLGVLLLARRTFPVLVLLASSVALLGYYVAGYPPVGLALPVAVALYTAAEAGRLRWAIGTALGLSVISVIARTSEGDDLGYLLGYDLWVDVALMTATVAFGDGVRARRLLRQQQRRVLAQERADRAMAAGQLVEQERLRIARDLHDVLAHTMSVISLHADVATEALADDQQAVLVALGHIRTASSQANGELRATLGLLREPPEPSLRHPVSGLSDVAVAVDSTTASGLPVTMQVQGAVRPLPAVVGATAYRIVQEALTNAIRHAHASRADVRLRYTSTGLDISVTDDGQGAARGGSARGGAAGTRRPSPSPATRW